MKIVDKACKFIFKQAVHMEIENKAQPFTLFPIHERERKPMPKSLEEKIK